jgi:hypothetical protein
MSDLGTRAPTPERKRLGSSRPITLEPIAKPEGATETDPTPPTPTAAPAKPAASPEAPKSSAAPRKAPAAPKTTKAKPTTPAAPEAPAGASPHAVESSSAATVGLTLRLPQSLYTRLVQYKEAEKLSYPTVVLVAVQSTYNQLPALIAARSIQIDNAGPNLFGLPSQIARRSTTATEPKQQLPIKVSPERRDVLTQIVESTGASSLNELVCTALEAFLPEPV